LTYCYTVGGGLADIFTKRYGPSFEVVRNVPVSEANFSDGAPSPSEVPFMLYQGALNEGRGLEATIMAMHHIEGIQLWIAGEGDLSQKLRSMVATEKLDHKIKFLGYLRPAALRSLTPKATIGLNLLENRGLSYYYSLANKAFDYIHADVPCIQMDFPEYRLLNSRYPTSILLSEATPEAIADAVKRLHEEPALYNTLKQHCPLMAAQLNWDIERKTLLKIYQRAVPIQPHT
jgi:glycosyltransferase involved in cell wall biosynthesis